MTKEYLTIDEMMAAFKISRSTAWKWLRESELPRYRFIGDRRTYIKREDLEKLREPIPIPPTKNEFR